MWLYKVDLAIKHHGIIVLHIKIINEPRNTKKIKINPFPDYNFYIQLSSKNDQGEFLPFTRYRCSFFNSQTFGLLHKG